MAGPCGQVKLKIGEIKCVWPSPSSSTIIHEALAEAAGVIPISSSGLHRLLTRGFIHPPGGPPQGAPEPGDQRGAMPRLTPAVSKPTPARGRAEICSPSSRAALSTATHDRQAAPERNRATGSSAVRRGAGPSSLPSEERRP